MACRHAAVLRAMRSSSVPPRLCSNVCKRGERLLAIIEEQQRVANQRCGDGRAEAAMLRDRADGVAADCRTGTNAMNSEWSRSFQYRRRVIAAAFVCAELVNLGCAGLAGHLNTLEAEAWPPRRYRGRQRLPSQCRMKSGGPGRPRAGCWGMTGLFLSSRGTTLRPVDKAARHRCKLKRVDQHHALTDRHVDRVVYLPLPMIFALASIQGREWSRTAGCRRADRTSRQSPSSGPSARASRRRRAGTSRRSRCRSSVRSPESISTGP